MISGEELAAYAAGEADPAVVTRVESALSADPSVGARLEAIREVDRQLAAWGSPVMDPAAIARLDAAVDADLSALFPGRDATAGAAGTSAEEVAREDAAVGPGAAGDVAAGGVAAGGVSAAGARPASVGPGDRARAWWRERLAADNLAGWVGGVAVAAVALVVGVGVVGGLIGGVDDSGADTTMMGAAESESLEDDVAADSFASGGVEVPGEAGAESQVRAADPPVDSGADAASDAPLPPVVDDGRAVVNLDDIDPAALRERLGPLVGLLDPSAAATAPGADGDIAPTAAAPEAEASAGADQTSEDAEATPLADGRVMEADVVAVAACQPTDRATPVVTEVIRLAPGRDVILYLYEDAVVAVAVADCDTLLIRLG